MIRRHSTTSGVAWGEGTDSVQLPRRGPDADRRAYLGPSFAVLLFARVEVLGAVAAIEFLPVIALAAFGARSARNLFALALAVLGVYLLTDVRLAGGAIAFAFAFSNAILFALYIVLADRVAKRPRLSGIDGLAAAMVIAAVVITPIGDWQAAPALLDPVALLAGVGIGVCSSVIPYVTDQLAMVRLPRATDALMVALLPAIATVIGIIVLTQIPSSLEIGGVSLVVAGVAVHHEPREPAAS